MRDDPDTREPGVLIATDPRMLHFLHRRSSMTHEMQCTTPLPSTEWTEKWRGTATAGDEQQWRGQDRRWKISSGDSDLSNISDAQVHDILVIDARAIVVFHNC